MKDENWEVVAEIAGDINAEMLRGLLEAQEIQVLLSQEGAGKVYGLTIPKLGTVQILVPTHQVQQAHAVLDDYYAGKFIGVELDSARAHEIEDETRRDVLAGEGGFEEDVIDSEDDQDT